MIRINRLKDILTDLQLTVNNLIDGENWVLSDGLWIDDDHWIDTGKITVKPVLGKVIDHILISPTESHLIKRLSDKKGIVLAVKMPDADANVEDSDNYSEMNHQLFFLLEKIDPGTHNDTVETAHYAKMQAIMKLVKEYALDHGLSSITRDGDELLAKPFHTEWEYQVYGGFNGISVSFDLQDFEL